MVFPFRHWRSLVAGGVLLAFAGLSAQAVVPTNIERVSVSPTEQEGDDASFGPLSFSADGRFVAFASEAGNFSAFDNGSGSEDIFVRDRRAGFTELVSRGETGANGQYQIGNATSANPEISEDGRFVAFQSAATNLVTGDDNARQDVFVRARQGQTLLVSRAAGVAGALGDQESRHAGISGDGQLVVFESDATNLVAGDANAASDIFLRDLATAGIFRISTDAAGVEADGPSGFPVISADGQFVAFMSAATNLDPNDTNGKIDIFVKELRTGRIELVSADDAGSAGDDDSVLPAISGDGRFVAFVSAATSLDPDDANGFTDVFVRDRLLDTTERVSISTDDEEGDADSGSYGGPGGGRPIRGRPAISDNGRFVLFVSEATTLVADDLNGMTDVFIRDREEATTERASVASDLSEGDAPAGSPAITPDGALIAFESDATNLASGDSNATTDVFVARISEGSGLGGAPIADAGEDQQVFELDPVLLDASNSFDPDDDPLTFQWRQIRGASVELDDPTSPTPAFDAPMVEAFDTLEFEVSVSDGRSSPQTDRVLIEVSAAIPGTVTGTVTDADGNVVPGATVRVFREDGQESTTTTDDTGFFLIQDARIGENIILVTAPDFEPFTETIDVTSDGLVNVDPVLEARAAILSGSVLLSNGAPLAGATVSLTDAQGDVITSEQGDALQAETDGSGSYRIRNISSASIAAVASIRVTHPSVTTWIESNVELVPEEDNTQDFRYGRLQVIVRGTTAGVRRRLNGTRVEILLGDTVAASNVVTRNVRRLNFPNVPATLVRVRAVNPNLTGVITQAEVRPGHRPTRVTATLRPRGNF